MPNTLEYLTKNDQALLQQKARLQTYAAGDVIIAEGNLGGPVIMIESGSAWVERGGARLAKLAAGDVCGEMSFLEATHASASVVAAEPTDVYAIPAAELQSTFESFPHLGARFYRSVAVTLSRRLRETSRRLAAAKDESAKEPVPSHS